MQHRKLGELNQRSSRDMVTHGRPEKTLGVLLPLVVSALQSNPVEFQIMIVCLLAREKFRFCPSCNTKFTFSRIKGFSKTLVSFIRPLH